MRQFRTSGSVRGAPSDRCPYRDPAGPLFFSVGDTLDSRRASADPCDLAVGEGCTH